MDIDRIKTFIRVAEAGSLSAASDTLRIAQPALSRQIRLLEAEAGQLLFTRSRAGMALTAAGSVLLARVSGLVRELEQSFEDVRAFSEAPRGEVTIGVVPTVAAVFAESLVTRAARQFPDVRLRLIEGYTGHILDWLHHREVDLALIYGPATGLHARVDNVSSDELYLIGPRGHDVFGGLVGLDILGRWPFVLPSAPHGLRLIVDRAAERQGARLVVAAEATSFITILQLVAAGIGLTVLPRSVLRRFAGPDRFDARPFQPALSRQVVLARPQGVSPSRAVAAIGSILGEEAARALAEG